MVLEPVAGQPCEDVQRSIDTENRGISSPVFGTKTQSPFRRSIWLNQRRYPMAAFTLSGVKGSVSQADAVSA